MSNKEIAMCLSIIKENIESIGINGESIIIRDVKKENAVWVIDEAIKALKDGDL